MKTKNIWSKRLVTFCIAILFVLTSKGQGVITGVVQPLGFNSFCATPFSRICQNGKIILIANVTSGQPGPFTYSWSSTVPPFLQTGPSNSYVVGPFFSIGSFPVSLTITDGFGGSTTTPIIYNVTVVSSSGLPTASLIPNPPLFCLFDSLKIRATAGNQLNDIYYVEHNSFIGHNYCPFSPIFQKIVQPDLYTNTFDVSTSDLSNTCKNYQVFNVAVNTSCNIPSPNIIGPITITQVNVPAPNYPVAIGLSGDVTISSSGIVSFIAKHFIIAPGSQIIVPNGATLIVDKSWLESCGCMWKGIQVQPGGTLTIKNASIIEDAQNAVEDIILAGFTNNINITQTLFNKNDIGINIHQSSGFSTGVPVINATLDNNIFTCRSGMVHIPGNVVAFNAIKNQFINNYNTIDFFVFPRTTTKLGDRSNAGILIRPFPAGVSTTMTNSIFDFLNYGVLAQQADINIIGSQFSNMSGNALQGNTSLGILNGYGIGVYAFSNDRVISTANIMSNNFYNLLRGVDIISYATVNVILNTLVNKHTDALSSFNTAGGWYGQCGIQLTVGQNANAFVTPPLPTYVVEANHLLWFATGIHVMRFYYNGAITITCNQIGDPGTSSSLNTYLWQGIVAEDVSGGLGMTNTNAYQIVHNNIVRALQNCVSASGISKGLYIFDNGTTHTNYALSGDVSLGALSTFLPIPNNTTAAIYVVNCFNGGVRCNKLHGPGYLFSTKGPVGGGYGILIDNSSNIQVIDNSLTRPGTNFGYGIDFRGACNPASFNNCQIHNCYYAYALESSSIGSQGIIGNPVRFDWHPNHFITANFGANDPNAPSDSPLTLFNNNIPGPGKNFGVVSFICNTSGRAYSATGTCIGLNPSGLTTGSYSFCLYSPPPLNAPDECGPINPILPFATNKLNQQQMDGNFTDSIATNLFGPERVFHNRRFLWERIAFDTLFGAASPMVQNFFLQNQNTAFGRFALTEKALATANITSAQSQNNFAAATNLEIKQQQVNNVKIKMADTTHSQPLTSADTILLKQIANGCPETDGRAFTEARTLLNILFGQQLHFTSNCSSGNSYRAANQEQNISTETSPIASVFPNPTAGEFTISYSLDNENAAAVFSLFNTNGEEVKKYILKTEDKSLTIKEDNLPAGVYFFKINCRGKLLQSGRLAVIK